MPLLLLMISGLQVACHVRTFKNFKLWTILLKGKCPMVAKFLERATTGICPYGTWQAESGEGSWYFLGLNLQVFDKKPF